MKFSIQKNVFEECLIHAARFVSSKISAIQSIQGALLNADRDSIYITTTNLNDFYYVKKPATIGKEGRVVFDHKKAIEFVSLLGGGDIEIEYDGKSLIIMQGKNKGYFKTYSIEDFPERPRVSGKELELNKEVVEKLHLVLFSSSKDEARPVLTGVFFSSKGGEGEVVSTDGFRLSLLRQAKGETELPGVIVSAQVLGEAVKQSKKTEGLRLTFSASEKMMSFDLGDAMVYSRVIEGEFPPYEKVIPKAHFTRAVVNKEELLRKIKLVSVFAREQGDIILFDIQKKGLVLRPKTTQGNETQVFMECVEFEGEDIKIAFNYRYVLDFLNTISVENVVIELAQSTAPAVFRDPKDENYLHIIMPLRTEETTSD